MKSDIHVELFDIKKQFGPRVLFSGLHCNIRSGDCVEITGKNGTGKSTLLKIIAGIVRPNAGIVRMRVNGAEVAKSDHYRLVGLVSPEVIMYPDLTGMENIQFLTQVRGIDVSDPQIQQCFDLVGLAQCRFQLAQTYSTGMKQRLKLAAMLAVRPSLWLLDEPSSNLDSEGRTVVAEIVRAALDYGAAVVIAINEPWEAPYASQKISLG